MSFTSPSKQNPIVLMAGGKGERMLPLTADCPKSLLRLGDKPILEIILESFRGYGFKEFFLSVNYMAEMIEEHFGNGKKWNVNIQYLRETEPLGTAGALRLLPIKPELPLFLMNGDVLTKANFPEILNWHIEQKAALTIGSKEYGFQVPYGVLEVDGSSSVIGLHEKPVHKFLVNAGIYVLNPSVLNEIPSQGRFDMTQVIESLQKKQQKISSYLLKDYWLDIGRRDDFNQAKLDYVNFQNETGVKK